MRVEKACKLIQDGIEHKQSSFSICHSWYFEYRGAKYRLVEMKGHYVRVETDDIKRTILDEIKTDGRNS